MIQGYKITERKRKQNNKADETESLHNQGNMQLLARACNKKFMEIFVLGKDSNLY